MDDIIGTEEQFTFHEGDSQSGIRYTVESEESIIVLEINKDGFFYQGERVDDVHNVYERFNEFLTAAERTKN